MSVINDVLKDLEARESHFTPIEIDSVEASSRARRNRPPLMLAAMLLPLLAAGAWFYLQQQPSSVFDEPLAQGLPDARPVSAAAVAPENTVAEPEPEKSTVEQQLSAVANDQAVAESDTAEANAPAEPVPLNQIVGLQIRESEQEMRMEFVMREKVVAYLRQRGPSSFGYHLRDIESRIDAPVISNNPWIRTLAIEAGDEGVDIRFETADDILVETRQNHVDGEPVWAISLRKAIIQPPLAAVADENGAATEESSLPAAIENDALAVSAAAVVDEPANAAPAEVRLEIKTTDPNAKVANQLDYAARLLGAGRDADAKKLLLELLGGVEDYQARRHLLAFYHKRELREEFEELALQSVTRYPRDAVFTTEYARSLFQGANYRGVIDLFDGQVSLDANQQALLAASYQRLDQHDSAIRHYRIALRQDETSAKNWIGLAISQEHSARLEAALDSYRRAAEIGRLNARLQAFVARRSSTLQQVLN